MRFTRPVRAVLSGGGGHYGHFLPGFLLNMGLVDLVGRPIKLSLFAFWVKVTEKYGEKPGPAADHRYPIEFPTEYMREGFPNSLGEYRWEPGYKIDLNHLYSTDAILKSYRLNSEYEA